MAFGSKDTTNKFIHLPNVATSALPTPAADGTLTDNEGGIVYDATTNTAKVSDGSAFNTLLDSANDVSIASGKKLAILDNGTASATGGAATLAKYAGVITSEALTTAAGAAYTLTLTNSRITATDIVLASVQNGTNTQGVVVMGLVTPGSSQVVITVRNEHASQAFNGTIKISFLVIKTA